MEMRRGNPANSVFLLILLAGLLSQNLVLSCCRSGSHGTPTHGTPPSPSSGTPPSHGGSGGYGTTPPSDGGGGSYNPTPSNPPSGNCGKTPHTPTPTPSNPPSDGGGYYPPSPPTSGGGTPPTPITASPPATPITDPGTPYTPPTPITASPPTTPIVDPGTPSTPPTSPFIGTCNYWRTHPGVIWGVLGWWGTLGHVFGVNGFSGAGASLSLPEALSDTRTDGLGALYREGTASFLNSMVNTKFPFTTKQVRESFVAALGSNKAAASQAQMFKLANEGHLKPRA